MSEKGFKYVGSNNYIFLGVDSDTMENGVVKDDFLKLKEAGWELKYVGGDIL